MVVSTQSLQPLSPEPAAVATIGNQKLLGEATRFSVGLNPAPGRTMAIYFVGVEAKRQSSRFSPLPLARKICKDLDVPPPTGSR